MTKITMKISWMHCASCSGIIEKWLSKKTWIKSIAVNLASNTASISYNETQIDPKSISKEIWSLGYKVVQQLETNTAQKYLKKFVVALILSLPIGATMFVNVVKLFGEYTMIVDIVLLLLGTIVVLGPGWNFHVGFIKKLRQWQSNMDTLISIGTLVARWYSLYAFGQTYLLGQEMHFYHFLEWAAFIITFISLWKYLELKSKGRASNAIQKLMQLQAKDALVLKDGKEFRMPIDDIQIEDTVIARAGDKVPVDGEIIEGNSSIDESMLTGENMPVNKQTGDEVFTGTIVQNGSLHIKVTKLQSETMLAKIVQTVNEAQNSKPPIQHLADKISGIFVPIILVIAISAFVGWYRYTGDVQKGLLIMVAAIVIACPCAMGLATPMAIMVATGTGASRGILIKWGEVLEKSKNIDAVVFDKTGTLTEGKPNVTDVLVIDNEEKKETIQEIAYLLSKNSHHPLSQAIVQTTKKTTDIVDKSTDFQEIAWKWLQATIEGQSILLGNKKLLDMHDIDIWSSIQEKVESLQREGKTVNYIAKWGKPIWLIALLDEPKQNTLKGIKTLQKMGIATVMISGDTKRTVETIAKQIAIDQRYGEVHPTQKADIVKKLQSQGQRVAFVGDGINDAPALVQSDLGIAIGQGADVAIEAAQMVLVQGDPYKVVEAIKLSRKTYKIIKQNLFRAFAYNTVLVPVAAFGLLLPMFASLAMSLSSVSVVLNSLRLKKS